MLRIAILEKEQITKDIIFELSKVMDDLEWSFAHFTKISAFAKADAKQFFDIVFFNETFITPRISAAFVESEVKRIVIYCMDHEIRNAKAYERGRILSLDRRNIKAEIKRIQPHLTSLLRSHKEYVLTYNNVFIPLRMQDIYYIEKSEKSLIYHTIRGEFRERKTMSEAQAHFEQYDFIRIHASYLVNSMYISKIKQDLLELQTHIKLPISRTRKKEVIAWFHDSAK